MYLYNYFNKNYNIYSITYIHTYCERFEHSFKIFCVLILDLKRTL